MSHEVQIHDAQTKILRELLFRPSAGYAELQKPTGLSSDHFNFHIKRLVELGYIEKRGTKQYALTARGKEHTNKLDTETNTLERQPKLSVIIVGWRERAGGQELEFLVQQRRKNPYYGYWGRLGGKIRWGETVLEAAARELEEETGLSADLEYKGLYHKMDYNEQTGELLEDKFFLIIKATNFQGELVEDFEGGHNAWLTHREIGQQDKVFQGMRESFGFADQDQLTFNENKLHYHPADY